MTIQPHDMLLYRRRCSCRRVSQHGRGCLCYRNTLRCSGGRLSSTTQTQRRPASWRQLILRTTSASTDCPSRAWGPQAATSCSFLTATKPGCDIFAPRTACAQSSAFLRGGGCQIPQINPGRRAHSHQALHHQAELRAAFRGGGAQDHAGQPGCSKHQVSAMRA